MSLLSENLVFSYDSFYFPNIKFKFFLVRFVDCPIPLQIETNSQEEVIHFDATVL
ncbi:hypothetical protein LguiA_021016 [Lonicera macranthoides]